MNGAWNDAPPDWPKERPYTEEENRTAESLHIHPYHLRWCMEMGLPDPVVISLDDLLRKIDEP